jgi:hypothetical protein
VQLQNMSGDETDAFVLDTHFYAESFEDVLIRWPERTICAIPLVRTKLIGARQGTLSAATIFRFFGEHIEHESLRSDAVIQELARESLLIRSGFSARCPQARCDRQVLVIDSGERLLSSCAVVGSGAASDQCASEV